MSNANTQIAMSRRRTKPRPTAEVTNNASAFLLRRSKADRPILTALGRQCAVELGLSYLFTAKQKPHGDGAHVCERINGPLIAACRSCVYEGMRRVQAKANTAAANLARRKQHSDRPIRPGTPGKIRAAREALSWTQAELAAAADVFPRSIQHWEAGTKQPTVASLTKLAAALQVTVADFLPDAGKR